MNNPQGGVVLRTEVASGEHDERIVAIGHRFRWWTMPIELIDVARLDPAWCQVLVRFIDDVNRPPVSMPYDELIEGLTS